MKLLVFLLALCACDPSQGDPSSGGGNPNPKGVTTYPEPDVDAAVARLLAAGCEVLLVDDAGVTARCP
jgi:hypothetical protein